MKASMFLLWQCCPGAVDKQLSLQLFYLKLYLKTIFPAATNILVADWVLKRAKELSLETPKELFSHEALQAGLPCHEPWQKAESCCSL